MLSTTIKRTIATALSGAAIAGTIGAPVASAMPIDPVSPTGERSDVPIYPLLPHSSASSAAGGSPDAGFDLSSAAIGPRPAPACSSSSSQRAGWRGAGR